MCTDEWGKLGEGEKGIFKKVIGKSYKLGENPSHEDIINFLEEFELFNTMKEAQAGEKFAYYGQEDAKSLWNLVKLQLK